MFLLPELAGCNAGDPLEAFGEIGRGVESALFGDGPDASVRQEQAALCEF